MPQTTVDTEHSFLRCPECLRALPHHSLKCSVYREQRRDLLKGVAVGGLTAASLALAGIPSIARQTHAVAAPSIGNTQEPGSASRPWDFIYIDGSSIMQRKADGQSQAKFSSAELAIQDSWDAGRNIKLGKGAFTLASPLSIADTIDERMMFEGSGYETVLSSSGNIFNFTGVNVYFAAFRNFRATSSGGHVFNFGTTSPGQCEFEYLWLSALASGKSCFTGTGGAIENRFRHLDLQGSLSNITASLIDLVYSGGGINQNEFGYIRVTNPGRAAIRIEEQNAVNFAFKNHIHDILGEITNGGIIALYGAQATTIESIGIFDPGTVTAPQILLSKTTGPGTKDTTLKDIYSRAGTVANPDIKFDAAVSGVGGGFLMNCDVGQIDFGGLSSIIYLASGNAVNTNIQNEPTVDYVKIQDGIITFENAIFRTKSGIPTTTDIPAGQFQVWKDTGAGATIKLYANDGGTIKSVALA